MLACLRLRRFQPVTKSSAKAGLIGLEQAMLLDHVVLLHTSSSTLTSGSELRKA